MIRLYGHEVGEGSFTQVTRGIERALRHHNVLAGVVPIDRTLGDLESFPGADAPISLNVGAPFVLSAALLGQHKQRWLMLAPNSDRLSPSFVKRLMDEHEGVGRAYRGFLTPSEWGLHVLLRHFGLPVCVAPHGITPDIHRPRYEIREVVRKHYADGQFRVLHMTSGRTMRKGTRELIKGWAIAKRRKSIPERAVLSILIEPHFSDVQFWAEDTGLLVDVDGEIDKPDITIRAGFGMRPEGVAQLYSHVHLVAQPSRGEGFGCIPLEALACGVPVLMTGCTGYSEYVSKDYSGTTTGGRLVVPTGESAPLDDFDNSVGPSLAWEDVGGTLAKAYSMWKELDEDAATCSTAIRTNWPWERVVEPAIQFLREQMKGV